MSNKDNVPERIFLPPALAESCSTERLARNEIEFARVHSPTGNKCVKCKHEAYWSENSLTGQCAYVESWTDGESGTCNCACEFIPTGRVDEGDATQMDWQQVVLNGGPPCFFVEGPQYCGRAERWTGHGNKAAHDYVSLHDLLATVRKAEREAAFKEALVALRAHQQAVRDRHYGVLTLAIESVEAAANGEAKG